MSSNESRTGRGAKWSSRAALAWLMIELLASVSSE
jgi:hypothetical protein